MLDSCDRLFRFGFFDIDILLVFGMTDRLFLTVEIALES